MDKFIAAMASLIFLVIVAVCVVFQAGQGPSASQGDGNATAMAIRIALADPGVLEATNNSYDRTCSVTSVSAYGDDGRSGLAGSSETLLKVSIMFGSTWAVGENRGLTVDVDSGKIVSREQYFRRLGMPPYTESIIVPPGASWYRRISGAYYQAEGITRFFPDFTFEPADAEVYATIVDAGNLSLFLNGSTYSALQFIDMDTNTTGRCVNRLIHTPWHINISIPDPRFHGQPLLEPPTGSYYVVMKNGDPSRSVEMAYDLRVFRQ